MGRTVSAIVYGVKLNEKQYRAIRDEDGDLLPGAPDFRFETGEGNLDIIGLAVAVQDAADERDGEAFMPEGPLGELANELKPQIAEAKRKWKPLVAWAKKHGVVLGEPGLILATVERA